MNRLDLFKQREVMTCNGGYSALDFYRSILHPLELYALKKGTQYLQQKNLEGC